MKILIEESSKKIRLEADCDFDLKKIDDALNFMKTIDKCMELSETDKDIKNLKDAFYFARLLIKKAREINENEKPC